MSTQDHQLPTSGTNVVPAHADPPHADPPTENPGGLRTAASSLPLLCCWRSCTGFTSVLQARSNLTIATDEAAIPTVSVMHPVQGIKADDLALPGNVEAFTDTPIYSRTNGYLKKWYFDIGAHVHKGDLLAEIETPEIDQQLNQSRAELERMQADANLAGVTSNRWQVLLAKHAVSQQEADQTRSNYIAAQAAVDASRANVRRLEQLQSYERIIAPFDGVITARDTDIGDLITAGDGPGSGPSSPRELFHLDASNRLRVYVSIPEVDSDSIHDGDEATLTQDANPNLKITGRIVRNADAINRIHTHPPRRSGSRQLQGPPSSRSLRLRPLPPSPDEWLRHHSLQHAALPHRRPSGRRRPQQSRPAGSHHHRSGLRQCRRGHLRPYASRTK